jgi:hypothetical protein
MPAILPFFTSSRSAPKLVEPKPVSGVVVRLELRTRDKAIIDKIVFSSLLVVAGKHPVEADLRVERDRPVTNEWDAPPTLSTLSTPVLTPVPSSEHLPPAVPPIYRSDDSSQRHLLAQSSPELGGSNLFGIPGPSSIGMGAHSSASSSIASAA